MEKESVHILMLHAFVTWQFSVSDMWDALFALLEGLLMSMMFEKKFIFM